MVGHTEDSGFGEFVPKVAPAIDRGHKVLDDFTTTDFILARGLLLRSNRLSIGGVIH